MYRDLQMDNFNLSNESRKVDFWWIFEDFQGFSMHFENGLHPNSLPPKVRPKPIFKKFKLEEKNLKFFWFFLIDSLCSKVIRKIVAHLWGPLGTRFPGLFGNPSRIFPRTSAHLPGDRELLTLSLSCWKLGSSSTMSAQVFWFNEIKPAKTSENQRKPMLGTS